MAWPDLGGKAAADELLLRWRLA